LRQRDDMRRREFFLVLSVARQLGRWWRGRSSIQSFPQPGGHATGFVNSEASMAGKWVELLKELAPATARVSIGFNRKTAPQSPYYLQSLEAAAAAFAIASKGVHINDAAQIEAAIADLVQQPNSGLIVLPDVFTATKAQRDLIILQCARHRIPSIYPFALFARAGGLASYGVDQPDLQRCRRHCSCAPTR
jgi:putative ABC transport system substrate-binding protein